MPKKRFHISSKTRRAIRKRIFVYGGGVILILLIGGFVYLGVYSDIGKVEGIYVQGNMLVSKEAVQKAVSERNTRKSRWKSWIGPERVLFWKSEKDIKPSAKLPIVEDIEIKRNLIERKIDIIVKEKSAKGVWCTKEKECYAFDERGIVFAEAPNVSGYLITKIGSAEEIPVAIGEKTLKNDDWFKNIMETKEEIKKAGVLPRTIRIQSEEKKEWEIMTAKGTKILLGLDFVPKDLQEIIREFKEKDELAKFNVLDFRVPDKIYVR
ncbi:hypothetical protein CL629_03495 [bacterium]|nr:hypothetical protein [bacterium]|tara:strand:- start:2958 stop:3755 length:798 start_codon:yes stop_codon:yes gene_type:complete